MQALGGVAGGPERPPRGEGRLTRERTGGLTSPRPTPGDGHAHLCTPVLRGRLRVPRVPGPNPEPAPGRRERDPGLLPGACGGGRPAPRAGRGGKGAGAAIGRRLRSGPGAGRTCPPLVWKG